jgi:hypothetical protein
MKRKIIVTGGLLFILMVNAYSQSSVETGKMLNGLICDKENSSPLPYSTIAVQNKDNGVISNEDGLFSLDISGLKKTDTICIQYIGYKTLKLSVNELDTSTHFYLEPKIYDLSGTYILGSAPDAKVIVKNVLKYKDSNYRETTAVRQTFIRQREINDINSFDLLYNKSTIPGFDEELLNTIKEKMPKQTTSYTDFLGNIYATCNQNDSARIKTDPVRMVTLAEKEFEDFEKFDTLFENTFNKVGEKEYWKVSSGIFGQKLGKDDIEVDTVKHDTVPADSRTVKYYTNMIHNELSYSSFDDDDQWEFLYETGKYNYTLKGGTDFYGEDVYIIDFEPKSGGKYKGRLYISMNTFALIRADYQYATGKTGRDIHLLGIGYTETGFAGSILFQKLDGNYQLKYFSTKSGFDASVSRSVKVVKKKKRALFDKELMEFKLDLVFGISSESLVEYYVLNNENITEDQYHAFVQPKYMKVIYVDQFDDNLWSGYSIIEPTTQMRDYKKQDFSFSK